MIGETILHYRVLNELGRGGMGVVYEAEDTRLGRKVALKFVPQELASERPTLERFQREARAASALNHPNICTVYDIGEHEGRPFIAMERLEGTTLREYIGTKPLTDDELLESAIQLADALEAAHAKGIIHRDIKSTNIFITDRGQIKILDFGLAKLEKRLPTQPAWPTSETTEPLPAESLTSPGAVIGTVAWMSPEQARGEEVDHRTDLYSLGVVLYEMATGALPFRGKTTAVIFDAILNQSATSPVTLNPALPDELARIIGRALEKDPEVRYQTASDLRADLKRLRRDIDSGKIALDTKRLSDTRPEHPSSHNQRKLHWLVAAVVLLLSTLGVGWYMSRPKTTATGLTTKQPLPELRERQLTANPAEYFLSAASISPKGTYLAYAAAQGQLTLLAIDGGETFPLAVSAEFTANHVSWFPDESKLLLTLADEEQNQSMWVAFVAGGTPRKLRDGVGLEAVVSPDGAQIAYTNSLQGEEIWLMSAAGEQPRRLLAGREGDRFFSLAWYPDGRRILYTCVNVLPGKMDANLESSHVSVGEPTVIVSDLRMGVGEVPSGCCLPDGTVIYSRKESSGDQAWNLWAISTNRDTGQAFGNPRRVTRHSGSANLVSNATLDGKRLIVQRMSSQRDVYLGEFEEGTTRFSGDPRRLTLDDRDDWPDSWMQDSKSIVFSSNRRDNFDIYRQAIDESAAQSLTIGPENEMGGRPSYDGSFIVYASVSSQPAVNQETGFDAMLMRVSIDGGPPTSLFPIQQQQSSFRCSRLADRPSPSSPVVDQI
ncbi:MAG: protein kinase [Pirellulaceae bacterium]|nr:protein kinase [Pirellulaceae bacterium]